MQPHHQGQRSRILRGVRRPRPHLRRRHTARKSRRSSRFFLEPLQFVRLSHTDEINGFVQTLQPALERAHQRIGRTGKAALKYAHRQTRCGAVERFGLVVGLVDVFRRRVVQALLVRIQCVTERVALPLRVERLAVEPDHFLFRPPDEITATLRFGKSLECPEGGKRFGRQKPPQTVVRKILAHVRCCGKQQDVRRRPAQFPSRLVRGQPGQHLCQTVSIRLSDIKIPFAIRRQFVRLVEYDKIVGCGVPRCNRFAHSIEHTLANECVQTDDKAVAIRPGERIPAARIGPADNSNGRRNSVRSSRSQLPTSPAGGTMSTRLISRRAKTSRR